MNVLGLDVSTSVVGWCVLDNQQAVVAMGHIDFKGCNNMWEKADVALKELQNIEIAHAPFTKICIEEPLLGFKTGQSSMATISTLLKFNGLLSYGARSIFKLDPVMISSGTARKTCGMKIQRVSKCGLSGKEQSFQWCVDPVSGPLKHLEPNFPRTKTGK